MDFTVINSRSLTSKKGNPFTILKLKNVSTGEVGDFPYFGSETFSEGQLVTFEMALNYRYQWTAEIKAL